MRKAVSRGKSPHAKRPKQAKTPSGRNLLHEQSLCAAINGRNVVELKYEIEVLHRTFEPHAIYYAGTANVVVTGLQTYNPLKPYEQPEIHNFIIGKIAEVRITSSKIAPDARIDRTDDRFKSGIICAI